jgi:acetyltransferase-like isoleucine patch superfamily enzyme
VTLEDRCDIGAGTRFHVHGHARIGAGATLGERCVVAAHERVEVGAGATLDDEVVLIDFDHGIADSERPIRLQGLVTARSSSARGPARGRRDGAARASSSARARACSPAGS